MDILLWYLEYMNGVVFMLREYMNGAFLSIPVLLSFSQFVRYLYWGE